MRIFQTGFEENSEIDDGIINVSGDVRYTTVEARVGPFGVGGSFSRNNIFPTSNTSYDENRIPFSLANGYTADISEAHIRVCNHFTSDLFTYLARFRIKNANRDTFFSFDLGRDQMRVYSGDFSVLQSTEVYSSVLPFTRWIRFGISIFLDSVNGYVKVYVDDDPTPIASWTGNTTNSVTGGFEVWSYAPGKYMDDMAINIPTMLYDTGTGGTPTLGATLTGGTSGVTAVIDAYDGNATSGRLFLNSVSGAFVDGETITDTGTFSAAVNAPTSDYINGLEPNSLLPGDGFIIRLLPNGDSSAGLTGSDGNSTNNYLLVDNTPSSTITDYVFADANGEEDKYTMQTFIDLGNPGSGLVEKVNTVKVQTFARKSGETLNNVQVYLETGAMTEYSDNIEINNSPALKIYNENSNTNSNFSESEIDAMIIGHKFNS